MGKKSKDLVPNAVSKLLASMRKATHTEVVGGTVQESPNAAILLTPPADQDGRPKAADVDAPKLTVPPGKVVSFAALADSSVPPLNATAGAGERTEEVPTVVRPVVNSGAPASNQRERSGEGRTGKGGGVGERGGPSKKRKATPSTESGAPGGEAGSDAPKAKRRKGVSDWFKTNPYNPEGAKSGDKTSFHLPLIKPEAASNGFCEFAHHTLTQGLREESELAMGASLLAHAANTVFSFACKERAVREERRAARELRRKYEEAEEARKELLADVLAREAELEELIPLDLELEEKLHASMAEADALRQTAAEVEVLQKKLAEMELCAAEREAVLAAKGKALEDATARALEQAGALDAAKAEAEACKAEQRSVKRTFYEKGVAQNIACLQHLGLLEFDRYCDLMSDPEVAKGLPLDPAEAEFASSDEEDDDEEDAERPEAVETEQANSSDPRQ